LDPNQPLNLTVHCAGLKGRNYFARDLLRQLHGGPHVRVLLVGDLWPDEPHLARALPRFRLSAEALSLHRQLAGVARPVVFLGQGWHTRRVELPQWDKFRAKARMPTNPPAPDDAAALRRLEGYAALVAHADVGGHLFVTEDEELLEEQRDEELLGPRLKEPPLWRGVQTCSRLEALAIVGALGRLRNRVDHKFYDGKPEETRTAAQSYRWMTEPFDVVLQRLPHASPKGMFASGQINATGERLLWLTFARDQVAVATVPGDYFQDLGAVLALSSLAVAAYALLETLYSTAGVLLDLNLPGGGQAKWSALWGALNGAPGSHQPLRRALSSPKFNATLKTIQQLRNAVAHTDPLAYHGYSFRGRSELRVKLSEKQAEELKKLRNKRQETLAEWGMIDDRALSRPWRFGDRLYRASVEAWMHVLDALLECAVTSRPPPESDSDRSHEGEGQKVIRSYGRVFRLRSDSERALLAGFADWPLHQDLSRTVGRAG
jgi:hypothetical protein